MAVEHRFVLLHLPETHMVDILDARRRRRRIALMTPAPSVAGGATQRQRPDGPAISGTVGSPRSRGVPGARTTHQP